jgi:hypothetical protein
MDENMPTEPLPPAQQPQPAYVPQQPAYVPQQPAYVPPQPPLPPQQHPHQHPADEPFYKRYGLAFAISTLILGAFVILGFVGAGAFAVGNVISHNGVGFAHMFQQDRRAEPGFPGQGKGQGNGNGNGQGKGNGQGQGVAPGPNSGTGFSVIRGTIIDISDSTWTVDTQKGVTVTVDVSSSTQFGAPGQSESASDFAVGSQVIVLGTRSDDTIAATRVLDLSSFKQPLPSTPGTPVTPGPSPSK